MTILASIIFFHFLSIFLAKQIKRDGIPWVTIFFATVGMTCCVLYLLFQMQPPDMGV